MQVLARVLGEGKSSRLYESLVKDKELATDVKIYPEMRIGPSGYYVEAMLRPGIDPDKAVKAIDAVLERAREQEISPAELAKARKMFRREMIGKRQTAYSTAIQIGHYEGLFRDPSLINTAYDKFSVVDPKRVKESAQKYLNPRTRAVLITLPDNEGQSPQGPSKPSVKDKP
ncbi:MAG: insulinase family protein [Elusimicrobia bacterium]|nr:insulinase family protein [Elusimicrobiota bacterium]